MNIELYIDPNSKYTKVDQPILAEACGILPLWALNHDYLDLPLREAFSKQYLAGCIIPFKGMTVDPDGTAHYPGDPPYDPILKIVRGEETCYIYQYAIVGIVQPDGSSYFTRMD